MPPKINWAGIHNVNAQPRRLGRAQREEEDDENPPPVNNAQPIRPVRHRVPEPRGRIRGLNGHLIQSRAWVFTLRLSPIANAINYVDPTGSNRNDYMIPPLATIQGRFNNPFMAPRGHAPQYISYQLELGNNGDPMFGNSYHYQGYIEFDQPVTATEIVEMMGANNQDPSGWWNWDMNDIYLAPREWSQQAAQRYTHKHDTAVMHRILGEFGDDADEEIEVPRVRVEEGELRHQNANVFEAMVQMVNNGANFNEISDAYPRHAMMMASGISKKIMERLKMNPPNFRKVKVYVFWGDSRTGKTRKVYEMEGDKVYSKTDEGLYFDGYDPNKHKALLLDECYGNYKIGQLLHWLEGHPHLLNQKFGGTYAAWERVYITSNVPPRLWFPGIPTRQVNALYKRLNSGGIVKFVDTNDPNSLRDHKEEVELNLNAQDRTYVIATAVDD